MPQLPTNLVNYLQALEAIITMGVLIYAVVIARDIREWVEPRVIWME